MLLTMRIQHNVVLNAISNPPCGKGLQKRMIREEFRLPVSQGCSLTVIFNCTECMF